MNDSSYASFAHPSRDPRGRRMLSRALLSDVARLRTRVFLRKYERDLEARSRGLVEVLWTFAESQGARDDAIAFPLSLASFRAPEIDPLWAAAQAALHLGAAEWEASFVSPTVLRFKTRATPPLARTSGDDIISDRIGCTPLPSVRVHSSDLLILENETRGVFPVEMLSDSKAALAEIERTLSDAVGLLETYAPEYLTWIADAIRAVVPALPPPEGGYSSGSLPTLPSVIHVSFPIEPCRAAESMIHEASHQYYHCAQLETLFSNGSDPELYYSPYPQKHRPIDRILIAFHAFANVTFFYRALGVEEEVNAHLANLGPLAEALERSKGLTPDGRTLFEAIRERLFS